MPNLHKKSSKRLNRSIRLRKYEASYDACVKKALSRGKNKSTQKSRTQRKSPKNEKVPKKKEVRKVQKSKERKRPLNEYQKFVRDESKKSKYKDMASSDRMSSIGKAWKSLK